MIFSPLSFNNTSFASLMMLAMHRAYRLLLDTQLLLTYSSGCFDCHFADHLRNCYKTLWFKQLWMGHCFARQSMVLYYLDCFHLSCTRVWTVGDSNAYVYWLSFLLRSFNLQVRTCLWVKTHRLLEWATCILVNCSIICNPAAQNDQNIKRKLQSTTTELHSY